MRKKWFKTVNDKVEGILISDSELEVLKAMESEKTVPDHGEVDVDEEIRDTLAILGLKFSVYPELDMERLKQVLRKIWLKQDGRTGIVRKV